MSSIRRSAIWNVFTETHKSDFIATCNICSQQFSYRSTTTNLMKHLQRMHPKVSLDLNSVTSKPPEATIPKEVEIVIEGQTENDCDVKSFKVEVQPVTEDCDFIVVNSGKAPSRMWDYFTKIPNSDSMASCNMCHKEFSYKTTTWNLKKHLDRKHPEQLAVSDETNCKFVVYNTDNEEGSTNENFNIVVLNSHNNVSPVWNFFTKQTDCTATCNFCQKELSYNSTTAHLQKHINRKHPQYLIHNETDEVFISSKQNITVPNSRKKVSPIWEFFTKISDSDYLACCNFCCKEISYKSTTTNLQKHITRKHPKEFMVNSGLVTSSHDEVSSSDEESQSSSSWKRESRMWEFFSKISISDSIASCNFCGKQISYKTSTGNLQKHIQRKHSKQLAVDNNESNMFGDTSDIETPKQVETYFNTELLRSSRKSSLMWNFFTKVPDCQSLASCNFCHKQLSYKTTTTNLQKHMVRRHPENLLVSQPKNTNSLVLTDFSEEPEYVNKEDFSNIDVQSDQNISRVWNFFTKLPNSDSMASCKFCLNKFSYKTTTWNLRKHLFRIHPNELKSLEHNFNGEYSEVSQSDEKIVSTFDNTQSQMWKFFTKVSISNSLASCNLCTNIISFKTGNINLIHHLNNKHSKAIPTTNIKSQDNLNEDIFKNSISTVKYSNKKRSALWTYFSKVSNSDSMASCNFCLNHFSYKTTIYNLQKHLDRVHSKEYKLNDGIKLFGYNFKNENNIEVSCINEQNINFEDSVILDCFVNISNTVVTCKFCREEVYYEDNITNLQNHIESKHPENLSTSKDNGVIICEEKTEVEVSEENEQYFETIIIDSDKTDTSMWNFFTKLPNCTSKASCNFCDNEISYRTIHNLRLHMIDKHSEYLSANSIFSGSDSDKEQLDTEEKYGVDMWEYFTKIPTSKSIASCNFCHKNFSYNTPWKLQNHLVKQHRTEFILKVETSSMHSSEDDGGDEASHSDEENKLPFMLWDFFTKVSISECVASCNFCQNEFSYKISTENLLKHITINHFDKISVQHDVENVIIDDNSDVEIPDVNLEHVLINHDRKVSFIWSFFTKILNSNSLASCNFCHKKLSYKTTIWNLRKHLIRKHSQCLARNHKIIVVSDSDEDPLPNDEDHDLSFRLNKYISNIWQFFTKIPTSKSLAICKFCRLQFSYKTTIWNLNNHLITNHLNEFTVHDETKSLEHNCDNSTQETSDIDEKQIYSDSETGKSIWDFFIRLPNSNSVATCTFCKENISYDNSTVNLQKHLDSIHLNNLVKSNIKLECTSDIDMPETVEKDFKTIEMDIETVENHSDTIIINSEKKTSAIWDFFTKLPNSNCTAACNICHMELSYRKTTWNLYTHINSKHSEYLPGSKQNISLYNNNLCSDNTEKDAVNSEYDSNKDNISIWQFYTEIPTLDSVASCNYCNEEVSYSNDIENLQKHIDINHSKEIYNSKELEGSSDIDMLESVEICSDMQDACKRVYSIWNFFTKLLNSNSTASCNFCSKELSYKPLWNLHTHMNKEHADYLPKSLQTASNISPVWQFFSKISSPDSVASCNICQKELTYNLTTWNLKSHLDEKHCIKLITNNKTIYAANNSEDDFAGTSNSDEENILQSENEKLLIGNSFTKISSDCVASCNFCDEKISYKNNIENLNSNHPKQIATNILVSNNIPKSNIKMELPGNFHKDLSLFNSNKKVSLMWNFFTKLSNMNSIASCNFCNKKLSYKTSTGNLQRHINRKHSEQLLLNQNDVNTVTYYDSEEEENLTKIIFNSNHNKSYEWDFFTNIPNTDSIASCNFCRRKFSYKTTTWNLKRHLVREHREELVDIPQNPDDPEYQQRSFSDQQPDQEFQQSELHQQPNQQQQQQQDLILENIKEFQNSEELGPDHHIDNSNLDNDFWNFDNNSDEDPEFRPSPTFDETVDIKSTTSGKKRSQIWNVFTEKPMSNSVAICNVCNQEFCYRSTTNNLKKHFQRKHPNLSLENKIEPVIEETKPDFSDIKPVINKNYTDDDDKDSSDEAVVTGKRKRSQIWNYFTRKKPNEYIATCNICKKELGFKSTTSNLKKHLDRKHPHIEIKTENEAEQKKNVPEVVVKTCLICLQNDQEEPRDFIQINNSESEEKSYMIKIQEIMNQTVVIDESHVICQPCVDDLEKVLQFKDKISKAFEFWSKVEPEPEPESFDNYTEDIKNSDYSDLEDGESLAKFTCSKCNKVFPSPSVMLKHNCGQQIRREKLDNNKESDNKDTKYFCDLCNRSFNIKWKLNKHQKRCQSNVNKQFTCTLCNRIFKKAYHLREHMASHTGERNYSCNLCGKTFQRSSSKHKHMRSHNAKPGEKSKKTPFLCTICGKSFPYSNGASRHMRVHLGERRHQCHICLKRFSQTTHLKVHLRTHSGERPYGCMICGRTFSLNASLRKHMRLHVGSGDFVKLVKNLETNLTPTATEIVTEDGIHVLTAVAHEIDIDGNQCIG